MSDDADLEMLAMYLRRIPSVNSSIGKGRTNDGFWWVKFSLDITSPLAWHAVQELAHVLNYLSLDERLPTVFKPGSPPPYMNGGPKEFLSWVIESREPGFSAEACMKWLEGRLPRPVDDPSAWVQDDDDGDQSV